MDNKAGKIYFCGSIRGGRADQELYAGLIKHIESYGQVLTAHVGDKDLLADHNLSNREIYERDMLWLDEADCIIAEVSTPSLGVGYEIARAVTMNKTILCLSKLSNNHNVSALISGCPDVEFVVYSDIDEAVKSIDEFIAGL